MTGYLHLTHVLFRKQESYHLFHMMKCLNLQILVLGFCIHVRLNLQRIIKFTEVRSSTENEEGTVIEEEVSMENNLVVRGVAFEKDMTRLTIFGLKNELTGLSSVFSVLAQKSN